MKWRRQRRLKFSAFDWRKCEGDWKGGGWRSCRWGLGGLTFWSGPQQFRVVTEPAPDCCGYVMAERVGGGYAVPFAVGLAVRLAGASEAGIREAPDGGLTLTEAVSVGGRDE